MWNLCSFWVIFSNFFSSLLTASETINALLNSTFGKISWNFHSECKKFLFRFLFFLLRGKKMRNVLHHRARYSIRSELSLLPRDRQRVVTNANARQFSPYASSPSSFAGGDAHWDKISKFHSKILQWQFSFTSWIFSPMICNTFLIHSILFDLISRNIGLFSEPFDQMKK